MFTENQVRQFYVLTSTDSDVIAPVQVSDQTSATDLSAKSAGASQFIINPDGDELYLMYKGPSTDGLQRSDRIAKCNIKSVTCTAAADLAHKMKKVEVALKSSLVSSSNLTVTGDYVLNVDIHNYVAMDYNTTKSKFAVARGVAGAAASTLYKALAVSLAKNFSREPVKFIKVTLKGDASNNEVLPTSDMTAAPFSSVTATGIVIEEVEQPWRRGAAPQEFVNFEASPSTIYDGTDDVVWGDVTDVTAANTNKIQNSKKVADMEWFFHKERGDRYGEQCFPYNIDTEYQVNPAAAYGYSFVDIHYYFEGNSHNVGHSEKTLTIVGPSAASDGESVLGKLIGAAATTGQNPTPATGLYAFLDGTGVTIKKSASWDEG